MGQSLGRLLLSDARATAFVYATSMRNPSIALACVLNVLELTGA